MNKLTVCRGCCCGTAEKHPNIDHERHLDQLRDAVGVERVRLADCLDACDYSNVVVVQPTPAARQAGARPVWLGGVLSDETVEHVVAWVEAGGPGRAAMPDALAGNVLDRSAEDVASA